MKISNWPYTIGIIIVAVVFCIAVFGCMTVKKAKREFDDHQAAAAQYCADKFPGKDSISIRDSTSYDTVIIQNQTYVNDTIFIRGDTVIHEKHCPPEKIITKIVRRDTTFYRESGPTIMALKFRLSDTARALTAASAQLQQLKERWRGKIGVPWWWLLILVFVIGGYTFLRVRKILSPIKI